MPLLSVCPVCGKPADARFRPFCGTRCADVDLGRWLTGQYRTPADDAEAGGEDVEPGPGGPETGRPPLAERARRR